MPTKLTPTRAAALREVADGLIVLHWPWTAGAREPRWERRGSAAAAPVKAAPMDWLKSNGLIRVEPKRIGTTTSSVSLTDAGRTALDESRR
ncbi:hypothetical protein CHO01_21860 [Cellulomonas hominis]|uniref:Winged helix DNA-binding domain-containing protein n=1 Tax=Cellulomonas hominis TaxID=156981 RepID=A0A511FCT9_9CELL|nr:hypothetical protein [Cellulomonas hominis]MBB5474691.1 hypothetical protein [Cellulomonas hominis]NKY05756.1 hypothetical protein [Cellulomonas hominis]GEL47070.1 hypothetical protein CHO01_21860 [Cellulomonas hominis]